MRERRPFFCRSSCRRIGALNPGYKSGWIGCSFNFSHASSIEPLTPDSGYSLSLVSCLRVDHCALRVVLIWGGTKRFAFFTTVPKHHWHRLMSLDTEVSHHIHIISTGLPHKPRNPYCIIWFALEEFSRVWPVSAPSSWSQEHIASCTAVYHPQ